MQIFVVDISFDILSIVTDDVILLSIVLSFLCGDVMFILSGSEEH